MKKKLLVIIPVAIILAILLILYFFRFEFYNLKVEVITDTEIYCMPLEENDMYYFFNKDNMLGAGIDFSDIKE